MVEVSNVTKEYGVAEGKKKLVSAHFKATEN